MSDHEENSVEETEKLNDERFNVVIFGVTIGTASGWDQGDTASFNWYDFEPNEKFEQFMPSQVSLFIDYETGSISCHDENEKETEIDTKKFLRALGE